MIILQFTHPVGVQRIQHTLAVHQVDITTHVPRVGRDKSFIRASFSTAVLQLIHPMWGATVSGICCATKHYNSRTFGGFDINEQKINNLSFFYYNTHASYEAWLTASVSNLLSTLQFPHPCGVWQTAHAYRCVTLDITIHAPLVGCDNTLLGIST